MKSIQCLKRLAMSLMLLCGMALMAMAEQRNYVVSGVVKDRQTMRVLSQVNVSIPESNISTVTNDDGYFLLKSSSRPDRILVSLIGYKSRYVSIDEEHPTDMTILMSANNIMLNEIFVLPDNPYDILSQALHRVNDNYGRQQRLMQTFYRETAQKHSRYIYVAEAVGEMLKTGYNHGIQRDWVSIVKGRSLVSPRPSDTLGVKIQGGPVLALRLDVVKNQDIIFNAEELQHYKFSMLDPEKIDDRLQNVIGMEPGMLAEHALFYGKFYVDNEDFTITRVELSLDMSNRDKATDMMLIKKPAGLRFKPKELSVVLTYQRSGGYSHLQYVSTKMRFNCDWKRRLLSSPFTVVTEMVVTDQIMEVHGKPGQGVFSNRDSFFDKVELFDDKDFWKDYNIIEPSESLEQGINKIRKLH